MNECANLLIFNKWGEVQFKSSGNNVIWDGFTSVGTEAQPGTYYFTISVKHHQKNGSIQLFRYLIWKRFMKTLNMLNDSIRFL